MAKHVIHLSSLDGKNGFRLDGVGKGDQAGFAVSNAGDVNGDGFDDVIVGAPGVIFNGIESGSGYVVLGEASGFKPAMSLSGLNGSNGFHMTDNYYLGSAGYSVSGAGDVNDDGFDDVIIGAFGEGANGIDLAGSSYVVFGKSSRFDAVLDLSSLNGKTGFRIDGVATGDESGHSVSNAGDVNGDGFGDVIINAILADPKGDYSGSSYVVFGKASGFSATLNLSSLDGNNGFRLDGEAAFDFSGKSVSTAGDINGDGLDDLIVGAGLSSYSGNSYVVFGKRSGFAATLDLASLNGSNGFRLDGGEYNLPGHSVSNAGDVNGDGFGDVVVGTRKIGTDGVVTDLSYVLFGKASGFAASLNVFELDGNDGFRIGDEAESDSTGYSVSGAGDVNGDGFDDLLIGAPDVSPSGKNFGSSYVVYGKASGFDAILNLSALDISSGFRIDGAARRDFSGDNVSNAGDVNGDGFDDVLIGASEADPNGIEQAGSSYVLFGGNFTHSVTHTGTSIADRLLGTTMADRFVSGNGNDNLLGRGGADSFDAGAGDDAIRIGDLTFASIDGGSGNDALHLAGKDLNLDLTALGHRIHDIETICLYGRGDNSLTLTADSLLNLSDSTNTLKVHGNSGDHIVVLDDGWIDGGSRGFYHTYTHDNAVLLVGANVMVEFF